MLYSGLSSVISFEENMTDKPPAEPKPGDAGQPPEGGDELNDEQLEALAAKVEKDPKKAAKAIKKLRQEAAANNKAAAQLAALQKERADAEAAVQAEREKALADQGKWQEVATARESENARLKTEVERLKGYEAAISALLEKRMESVPESLRTRIPEFDDPVRTLNWIEANPDLLAPPQAPDLNQGKGNTGNPRVVEAAAKSAALAATRQRMRSSL
jgi:hypothetical protein